MKKWKLTIGVALLIALSAIVPGGAGGGTTLYPLTDTTQTHIAAPVKRIVVTGTAGQVKLIAGGRSGVDVVRTTSWWLPKPRIRQYVRGDVLYVESKCASSCHTDLGIRMPGGVAVDIREHAAAVQVEGAPGDVSVDTHAGSVRIELTRAPRRIEAATRLGDVHVSVPRGAYAVSSGTRIGEQLVSGLVRDDLAARAIRATTEVGNITIEGR
jgi:hypothetical protein